MVLNIFITLSGQEADYRLEWAITAQQRSQTMDNPQGKKSFLTGALVLTGANLFSQVLGLFSKLAIFWLLGEEGVGIYNYPYALFAILLSFSSVGFNVAISKLIAERIPQGKLEEALHIFYCSLRLMIIFGFLATTILVIIAWPLAIFVHKDPRAIFAYIALAPAALLSSWQAAYRGFFQGNQNMYPNALSQIVEQVFRILAMLGLAALLLPYGLEWGAAGAVLGAAAGAIGSYFFLRFLFHRAQTIYPWNRVKNSLSSLTPSRSKLLIKEILTYAIPIGFAGIGLPLFLLADSLIITNRLQAIGMELSLATAAYGALANNAMSLVSLPTVLSSSLFVSLVPAIAEAKTHANQKLILSQARSGIKVTLLFALPAAAGMYMIADPFCSFIGMGGQTAPALRTLTFGLPFLVLQQVSSGILQGLSKAREPVYNMFMGAIIKAAISWLSIPIWGIAGAAWGTNIGFAYAALSNLHLLFKELGSVINWSKTIIKPILAIAIMCTCILLWQIYGPQDLIIAWQLLAEISIGVCAYLSSLAILPVLTDEDLDFLPLGRKLARIFVH